MPANLIILAHFSVSATMSLPKSAEEPGFLPYNFIRDIEQIASSIRATLVVVVNSDRRHRRLLRVRRERPHRRRAAEQRDEVAAPHSITSSATASSLSGTARPSMWAVEALMTSSNLVDCTTGRSAGLAPLRMRPT